MKNKLLKTAMISAVAFTPVYTVGLNVEKASAATTEDAAGSLAKGYKDLTADQKKVFDIVLANLKQYMGEFIQSDVEYKEELKGEMQALVAPYSFTTEEQLKSDLTTRFNTFATAAQDDLGDEGNVEELLSYIQNVSNDLVNETGNVSRTLLNDFYNKLFSILNDNLNAVPTGVRDILQVPNNPATIITEIQSEVNAAFSTGGGPVTPPTDSPVEDDDNGEISTGGDTVEKNPQQVIDAINGAEEVEELVITLEGTDTEVSIPGTIFNALENKNSDAVIVVETSTGAYELPVSAVDLEALAEELDVTTAELKVVIKVDEVQTPALVNAQYDVILPSIDFEVTIIAPNGESIVLNLFPQPVKRSITATQQLAALTTVGVTVINGQVRGVPTFVTPGNKTANLYRAGNSTYTLVENFKTFKDVDKGANWSEEYVEKLASRLIVSGTTADTFSPNRSITRGEFASILARGLGLVAKNPNVPFTDVSSTQAFNKNSEIAAVVEAGIVSGYKDGKFRPYQEINRGEAAIMISKALEYYGADLVTLNKSKKVSNFEDYRYIGASTRPHIEKVFQAGYINGYSDGTYKSTKDASRAEMSRILYDFLNSIEFIN
jgi:hypothetical protein